MKGLEIMEVLAIYNTVHPVTGELSAGVKLLLPLDTEALPEITSDQIKAFSDANDLNLKMRNGNYRLAKRPTKTNAVDQEGNPKAQVLQAWYKAPNTMKTMVFRSPGEAPSEKMTV